MGFYSALATAENLFYSASKAPTLIYLGRRQDRALKDPEYLENLKRKEDKKEVEKEMRKSERAAEKSGKNHVQENVKNDIMSLEHNISEERKSVLFEKAKRARKLISFVDYYLTNEEAKLVNFTQNEKEFINAVSEIYGFGKLYPECISANLKQYDLSYKDDYLASAKYLLSIKDLEMNSERIKNLSKSKFKKVNAEEVKTETVEQPTEEVKEATVAKEEIITTEEQPVAEKEVKVEAASTEQPVEEVKENTIKWETDEDGIVHPIFFTSKTNNNNVTINPTVVKEEPQEPIRFFNSVPEEIVKELDEKLSEFIGSEKHRYEYHNSLIITLFITRNGVEESFLIDPNGYMHGMEKLYVMGNLENGNKLFVSIEHKDVVKKILSSSNYVMTADDYQKATSDQFKNVKIYTYIDMSNTEFLKSVSKEDFEKLGKKLSFIINKMIENNSGNLNLPRLRFLSWNNVDKFKLISDNQIKVPLEGVTANLICNGLTFSVENDSIKELYNGVERNYTIEKYGEM